MFTGMIARMLMMQALVIPGGQLHATWSHYNGVPGAGVFGQLDQNEWTWAASGNDDWMILTQYPGASPTLTLNARGGVVGTNIGQAPNAPEVPGFVLTDMSTTPFRLEFTCQRVMGSAWGGPTPLVVTITK